MFVNVEFTEIIESSIKSRLHVFTEKSQELKKIGEDNEKAPSEFVIE